MTQLQINKTWNNRMTGGVINHFFENMIDKNFTDYYHNDYHRFEANGTIYHHGDRGAVFNRYHNTGMKWFLASKEALDEVDTLNQTLFNGTVSNMVPTDSIYYTAGARYGAGLIDAIWEVYSDAHHFGNFINNNIVGKETAYWRPISNLDFDNLTVTPNNDGNSFNVKYSDPFKFSEHFNHAQFTTDGNTDLFLVIPYVRDDGYRAISVHNPELGTEQYLSSYVALKITDMAGDGDIKFDHIDDIDYIDKLEFTLTTPHLI